MIWKDVIGREGEYLVSEFGDVKSLERQVPHYYGQRTVPEKILAKTKHNGGYLMTRMGRTNKSILVHRLVALAFLPKPEGKEFVNHIDGNKHNNHVSNLEWCTRQENETHAYGTGLKNSTGSHNQMAKLDEQKVGEIRRLFSHYSKDSLSKMFGVHKVTIERIINRKVWKHVA